MTKPGTFQELILALQSFWASKGCVILQPFDMEMGAGTFHPGGTFYVQWVRSPGLLLMYSRVAGRRMAAMVKIQSITALLPISSGVKAVSSCHTKSLSQFLTISGR